ncbi:MAG: hypothetical protein K6B74_01525 [Ruminococcus sp.]|nr:hypothetical protein [Ruminococcus sp.]
MKCPKCGSRILLKKGDKCPKCGEPLANEKDNDKDKTDKKDGHRQLLPLVKLKKDSGEDKERREKPVREKTDTRERSSGKDNKDSRKKLESRKKDKIIEVKTDDDKPSAARTISLKALAMIAAAVLLTVLILILVLNYRSAEGERYAESACDYIGKNVRDLNDAMTGKVYYADSSKFAGVNNAVRFDAIAESGKSVKAGGVKYPQWAVTVKNDKNGGFISDVIYTDFSVVKGDMRGIRTDGLIDLDKFSEGEKKSSVLREIKPRPYSISCSQTGIIVYTYKYWYKLDNGDEQAAILRVGFSEKGDYKYSATELIIPPNM